MSEPTAADGRTYSEVAHAAHRFCNPLSAPQVERVIEQLGLSPGARVLDAGCGKGEMLLAVTERFAASGVGIDRSAVFLAAARERAVGRVPAGALELLQRDLSGYSLPRGAFDLAMCIGATRPFGGYRAAIGTLAPAVRAGGLLLLGEGFWRRAPARGYLEVLGARRSDFTDHRGNVAAARAAGLDLVYAAVSAEQDWDHYEGLVLGGIEQHAESNPDAPEAAAWLRRIRRWHDAYLRWGRDTLGFALYLFRAPGRP